MNTQYDPSMINALGEFKPEWGFLLPDMFSTALKIYGANSVLKESSPGIEYLFSCQREGVPFSLGIRLHEATYHIQTTAPDQNQIYEIWQALSPITDLIASLDDYVEKMIRGEE